MWVRGAIYVQNLLSILAALWALWDGKVTAGELEYAEMQTTTNLILAFAILISSMVQASTLGISNYHANIVLMMSWMNNTNAFVYFILYVHHKIGLPEAEGGVGVTWRDWVKHVKNNLSFTLSGIKGTDTEAGTESSGETKSSDRQGAKVLVKRYVLVLGSLHLTLMAALGVWLWSDLERFGLGNRRPGDFETANALTLNKAVVAILGQGVSLSSSTLRIASLVIYSLFLIPGLNLIAPMILFLAAYFGCRRIPFTQRWEVLPAYVGLGILLTLNLVFIVDIELTRDLNLCLQAEDEADWGFGQILAILLLLLPLRDLVEAILARRLKKRQGELEEDLQEAIEKEEYDRVKRAIERGSSFPSPKSPDLHWKFWNLISTHGALDYFDNLRRTRMTIADKALEADLHSAIRAKDESRMTAAHDQGADLIAGVLQLFRTWFSGMRYARGIIKSFNITLAVLAYASMKKVLTRKHP
ncbi:hypothetical protein BKA70DRAFT_816985 [Coprinopsis sp. MPI-PUGE-AT-0042]|nr:hypothetical protein BKA70DRAFT_816985 [Coprinopsis sp. MPI-PUGE-AT-0042]